MTYALAILVSGFKDCCMLTGKYDGEERDYYF
jgi:hypothetical protein